MVANEFPSIIVAKHKGQWIRVGGYLTGLKISQQDLTQERRK
jgi:hypothetical protein